MPSRSADDVARPSRGTTGGADLIGRSRQSVRCPPPRTIQWHYHGFFDKNAAMRIGSLLTAFALTSAAVAADHYADVQIDRAGRVQIVTQDGRHITPTNDVEQIGAKDGAISPDHRSVGWLALYGVPGQSYPIALKLAILRRGRLSMLRGKQMESISYWGFQNGGRQVAFK